MSRGWGGRTQRTRGTHQAGHTGISAQDRKEDMGQRRQDTDSGHRWALALRKQNRGEMRDTEQSRQDTSETRFCNEERAHEHYEQMNV